MVGGPVGYNMTKLYGEISPLVHGAVDSPLYQQSFAKCENAVPDGKGPVHTPTGS